MASTTLTALRCSASVGQDASGACGDRSSVDGAEALHCSLRRLQQADSAALLRLVHAADPLWSQRAVNLTASF